MTAQGISKSDHFRALCEAMRSQAMVWIGSILMSLLIAITLILTNRTMSWFGHPLWIYFLYTIPTLGTGLVITRWSADRTAKRLRVGKDKLEPSCWTVFQIYFDGTQLLWTFLMIIAMAVGVLSGFLALLWVVFASIYNILHRTLERRTHGWRWLCSYILLIGIPFLQAFYLGLGAINMFLPIMGRTGSAFNSEFIIALLMSAIFTFLFRCGYCDWERDYNG